MIRTSPWAVLALCAAATVPVPAFAAPAAPPPATRTAAGQPVLGCGRPGQVDDPSDSSASFTGLPAANDVAVGVPGATRGSARSAGLVEVRFACAAVSGVQELALPKPRSGDRFGAAVTVAHLNGDLYDDLVVGVPGLDVGGKKDAGGIALFLGSPEGLVYTRTLTQSSAGVPGSAQAGAHFGAVLTFSAQRWYDDEPDGLLGVGIPDKDVSGVKDAGAVVLMRTLQSNDPAIAEEITLATARVPGAPGKGDHLGAAIDLPSRSYRLGLGLPGRKVGGHARAGAVLVVPRDEDSTSRFELLTQDSRGMAGAAETGDGFGAAVRDGWIGVPGEDLDGVQDAGMLQSTTDGSVISQETAGFPGRSRRGDRLGASVSLWVPPGVDKSRYRVLAGIPGKDVDGVQDAGAVLSFKSFRSGSPAVSFPEVTTMPKPVRTAHFGAAVTRAGSQVLVAAPGADAGRGRVAVYTSPGTDVPLALQGTWTQTTGRAGGSGFGSALGGIPTVF